jgi:hypothetical protein
LLALALLAGASSVALAQPAQFIDLGTLAQPATPAFASESYSPTDELDFGDGINPGETISVRWVRFEVDTPLTGDTYLDIDSYVSNPEQPLALVLYDGAGNLLVSSELGGSGFDGNGALSFGSIVERVPFGSNPNLRGQQGDLPAGTYWLALVAGPLLNATVNAANWDVTTTESFALGYGGDDSTNFISVSLYAGNTTPVPAPANNDCANATDIAENVGNTPAWTGSNFGASADGAGSCYPRPSQGFTAKDVWLRYVPTITGWVEVSASTSGPDSNSAILAKYDNGCGTFATRCIGGGNFDFGSGTRMAFQVVAGEPVLLAVAQRGGFWGGTIRVDVRPVPAPCDIQTPAGATPESELACGDNANGGCNASPRAFDPISLGETVTGTLWNTLTSFDQDWYEFTLEEAKIVTLTSRSQLAVELVLFEPEFTPNNCFGPQPIVRRTPNFLSPCTPLSGTAVLEPGVHKIAIGHRFRDGFDCASGYNGYWLSLTGEPCDQPELVASPQSVVSCLGGSATFTSAFISSEEMTYQWQAGVRVPGEPADFISWNDIFDGDLSINFSVAQLVGTDTPTLTISDIDELAREVVAFRVRAITCAGRSSETAFFTINDSCTPACDSIDFNGDSLFPDDSDLIDFLSVLAGGPCSTGTCSDIDFNNDELFPDDSDLVAFLRVLAGGDC